MQQRTSLQELNKAFEDMNATTKLKGTQKDEAEPDITTAKDYELDENLPYIMDAEQQQRSASTEKRENQFSFAPNHENSKNKRRSTDDVRKQRGVNRYLKTSNELCIKTPEAEESNIGSSAFTEISKHLLTQQRNGKLKRQDIFDSLVDITPKEKKSRTNSSNATASKITFERLYRDQEERKEALKR